MGEVYPPDNTLLSLQVDNETGVSYITTGQSPYYLQFRKMLHRLLLSLKRGNDLRVYDEGVLNVGVKPGKFWLGTQLINYIGSTYNTLADDKSSIYLYLDSNGNLVTNEYTAFPDMATTPHIRLATVITSDGDINSIA